MGYTDYLRLKDAGDAAERSFIDFLQRNGFTNIEHIDNVWKQEGLSLSDWDVRAVNPLGITVTYEVKGQDRCHTFGMHNIEQVQYGKPGGIAVSKADIWVFVNPELGFGMIESDKLKKINWNIVKDPTVNKKSYEDKVKRGDLQLWITKYKNFACGWRQPNDRLEWNK